MTGRTVTYGQLADRVAAWRGGLVEAGLEPGNVVGLVAGNSDVFVVAYLAILSSGMIAVPLNPSSPAAELRRELATVSCQAVVVGPAGLGSWGSVGALNDLGVETVIGLDERPLSSMEAADPRPGVDVGEDSPAVLLFTSGTAGPPKAAILTHKNLWSGLLSVLSAQPTLMDTPQVSLAVIPLFHVFGLNVIVNLSLFLGATIVLADYESPTHVAELVRRHRVTQLAGPPNLWAAIAAEPGLVPDDFVSLSRAISGSAKLAPAVWVETRERLGIELDEGYGLTETCATACSAVGQGTPVGSVGPLMPGVEARIVNDACEDVLVGDPGELLLKGDMVSPGYWNDPDATRVTRTERGWLRTGDLAVVDDDGNVSIIDRIKDLIIVSGFNVHPGEVEAVLASHPTVAEAAVRGRADPVTGESIVAYAVPVDGAVINSRELMNHCSLNLARYKIPHQVTVVAELPKTLIGKVKRRDLDVG